MNAVAARARKPRARRMTRGWPDLAMFLLGGLVLVLASLPVDNHSVPELEGSVFRIINDHTVVPFLLVWPIMQLGNFLVIPVAAAVAAAFRKWRLAVGILIGGIATYELAKVVKGIVPRGRPAEYLANVDIRGAEAHGRGYVSGHAAVVTLIAALAWPYLGRRGRIALVVLVVLVCLARVYVAAHLPLDVIGGAALGLAIAGVVRLAIGRPG